MIPKGPLGGFALIEVLVALTLLSACLSVTAGLLMQALRHEREAACRSAATRLAASLADELRLLRRDDGQALRVITDASEAPPCIGDIRTCAVEMAAAQALAAWRVRVSAALPEGSWSQVELLDAAAPSYLIQIGWPSLGAKGQSRLRLAVET